MTTDEELLEKIMAAVAPGKSPDLLTPEEKEAVYAMFDSYKGKRGTANLLLETSMTMPDSLQQVGRVAANNPWRGLAKGLVAGTGMYLRGKADQREALGRKKAAALSGAIDYTYKTPEQEEEEERMRRWEGYWG